MHWQDKLVRYSPASLPDHGKRCMGGTPRQRTRTGTQGVVRHLRNYERLLPGDGESGDCGC